MLTLLPILFSLIVVPATAHAHTPPKVGAPAAASVPHPQDVARRDRLRRMLSVRDHAPACATLTPGSDRLVEDLQWLMDHITAPPWVGVRAAQCIIELHAETEVKRIEGWVQDSGKPGLILVVLGALNQVSPQTARTIAQAALKGPHTARVQPRLMKSKHPEVRALVAPRSTKP